MLCLVYAECECNYEVHYNIIPSQNAPCPQDPCLTISQFAANSSIYHGDEMSISLFYLPGNHNLDRELSLMEVGNISMTNNANESIMFECVGPSGRFVFNRTNFVLIKGLYFVGCGGNTVTQVNQFVVQDTIFQGELSKFAIIVHCPPWDYHLYHCFT